MLQTRVPTIPMSLESLKSFQSRLYRENTDQINGLSFNNDGNLMVTSSNDDSLVVYDLLNGKKQRKVNFPKSGCHDVRYLHTSNDVILATKRGAPIIKHFSLYNNKCVRFFKGHEKPISHLNISPDDDLFLSSSNDSVRLWDVRAQEPVAALYLDYSDKNVAFDPEGLIFAISTGSDHIRLFDKRAYNNGPFSTFDLTCTNDQAWPDISFSPDGKYILVVTDGNHLRLVDSYDGGLTTLTGHSNENRLPLRASFTPCSKYLFCGGTDNTITFWEMDSFKVVLKLRADHMKPIQIVDFNRKYHMLVSCSSDTKIWFPNNEFVRQLSNPSVYQPPRNSNNYQYH